MKNPFSTLLPITIAGIGLVSSLAQAEDSALLKQILKRPTDYAGVLMPNPSGATDVLRGAVQFLLWDNPNPRDPGTVSSVLLPAKSTGCNTDQTLILGAAQSIVDIAENQFTASSGHISAGGQSIPLVTSLTFGLASTSSQTSFWLGPKYQTVNSLRDIYYMKTDTSSVSGLKSLELGAPPKLNDELVLLTSHDNSTPSATKCFFRGHAYVPRTGMMVSSKDIKSLMICEGNYFHTTGTQGGPVINSLGQIVGILSQSFDLNDAPETLGDISQPIFITSHNRDAHEALFTPVDNSMIQKGSCNAPLDLEYRGLRAYPNCYEPAFPQFGNWRSHTCVEDTRLGKASAFTEETVGQASAELIKLMRDTRGNSRQGPATVTFDMEHKVESLGQDMVIPLPANADPRPASTPPTAASGI